MKVLIDMNLSPEWVQEFKANGIDAIHWSSVGRFDEKDSVIMEWARSKNYVIFTHDLDFGTTLALTKAEKPSVFQVRTQNITIAYLSRMVITTFIDQAELIERGALVVVDDQKKRVRILPLK